MIKFMVIIFYEKISSNFKQAIYVCLMNFMSIFQPSVAAPVVPASMGFSTEDGTYVGKKRVAHNKPSASNTTVPTTKPSVATSTGSNSRVGASKKSLKTSEKVVRPKLVMEIGGKVRFYTVYYR